VVRLEGVWGSKKRNQRKEQGREIIYPGKE
jgi:hypothetical protein